jgi:hypothetical protein
MMTLRNGQVIRHEALRDDISMLGQLGVFPPEPGTVGRMVVWRVSGRAKRAAAAVTARRGRRRSTENLTRAFGEGGKQ